MNRESAPAPRFGARILALLSGRTGRLSAADELAGTRLALSRTGLPSRRDGWRETQRPEPLPFDAFRGFRDPASPNA